MGSRPGGWAAGPGRWAGITYKTAGIDGRLGPVRDGWSTLMDVRKNGRTGPGEGPHWA